MTTDRLEDIGNREFYNHLPTRRARITFECDVRVDAPEEGVPAANTLSFATDPMGLYSINVRNVEPVDAKFISDEVRYLDTLGHEVSREGAS